MAVQMEDNEKQVDDVAKEIVEEETEEMNVAETTELVIDSYIVVVYGRRWFIAKIWMMTTPSRLHA